MLKWRAYSASRLVLHRGWRSFSASTLSLAEKDALSRTRNIGIIAHIDAGKTTTTERMLYYSGHTRRIGDVDDGSTVTDFLPAERARGITIQSAAVSFKWPPVKPGQDPTPQGGSIEDGTRKSAFTHNINLIDTPGHADFTFEVLRSLRILDGAICILDGVAGVEAQTEKVWIQANRYQIPRITFVNKLDRDGAAFHRTVKEIGTRLHVWPAVCQIPWWQPGDRKLCGLGDVVGLRALQWQQGSDGRSIEVFNLSQLAAKDPQIAKELEIARMALVELLSEHDEEMVERFLEHDEDHLAISEADIMASLRRCTLHYPQEVAPVFAGASFRNIGVQPLLDAVVDLLPSPSERPDPEIQLQGADSTLSYLLDGNLALLSSESKGKGRKSASKSSKKPTALGQNLQSCALAFKVVNDSKRGVLVYVRVYSGSITRGTQLFNTNLNITERAPKLLQMYASDAVELPSIDAGQIGVIVGLKYARTGDTLISYSNMNPKNGPPAPLDTLHLRPIDVPPPVFFTSVEPNSLSEEKPIKDSLQILLREDPSLNISTDTESGQTHLAGMGELHLEIARDRLIQDFKAKAHIGKIEINYREAVEAAGKEYVAVLDREVSGKHARATSAASVSPMRSFSEFVSPHLDTSHSISLPDNNHITILHPTLTATGDPIDAEDHALPSNLSFSILLSALQNGVTAALARGPTYCFPIHSTHITLRLDPEEHIFPDTSPAAISIATRQAVQGALQSAATESNFALMEPVMQVTISVNENDLGSVVHDLSSARGGQILSLDGEQDSSTLSGGGTWNDEPLVIDSKKIYVPPDPFSSDDMGVVSNHGQIRMRQITARVPLREMVGYLKYLRSLTGGRGTFVMQVDRFEKVTGQRLNGIVKEIKA